MSQEPTPSAPSSDGFTAHRFFASYYERTSRNGKDDRFMTPLRQEVIPQAGGRVLEIGAGNGLNFAFYAPENVESVEAIEPDSVMLMYARRRAEEARVPVRLVQAAVEKLPFADESFDSAVATLVFCSVTDPRRGLSEVWRVLKPGGTLLLVEHVRARGAIAVAMQDLVTPFTRRLAGNCHWNRNTEQTVREAGFTIEQRRAGRWFIMPFVVLHAVKR